ncbi:MAG TPA: hypothetical protein ENO10_01730 [Salinimicrobium catena]|uniref:Uncharacterized protein n=1 Tax=Salinimicrobium catena TaxID=390640 RepID=A0A7C2M8I2_9FLAO|nr:hypothetical protein [Salinimicrobium catena]
MKNPESSDPKAHSESIRTELGRLAERMRKDISKIDDPRGKALFETSAEVLNGLSTAFLHYEQGKEEAWK